MARPLRLQYPGALYHLTGRGNERKDVYRTDEDRRAFLVILAQAIERYRLILHAYVLMDNHYHLLLETTEANLSLAMRHLNGGYTSYFNRTHNRIGHPFQGRYKAILVEKESYLLELSRYIHLNPIRAKIKVELKRYPWSSYPDYIGIRRSPAWLSLETVLKSIDEKRGKSQRAYKHFVEEGAREGVGQPWESVLGQVILGGKTFVQSIQARLQGKRDREIPSLRLLAVRPSWDVIARRVEEAELKWESLRTGNRSNPKRAVMIYLGRERAGMPLKDLAKRIGLKESSISQTAGRVSRLRLENSKWNKALIKIEKALIHNL